MQSSFLFLHILHQSQVDAEIHLDSIPKFATLRKQDPFIQNQFAACGGDDYEICFTALKEQRDVVEKISRTLNLTLTRIGQISAMKNKLAHIDLYKSDGTQFNEDESKVLMKSFDHFR